MLYCRTCGQCGYVNEDNFYETRYTSGWEENTVGCWDGDYIDTVDSEHSQSDFERYNCPHCQGEDVESDSEVTKEEALLQRKEYDEAIFKRRRDIEMAKIKDESWDPVGNI